MKTAARKSLKVPKYNHDKPIAFLRNGYPFCRWLILMNFILALAVCNLLEVKTYTSIVLFLAVLLSQVATGILIYASQRACSHSHFHCHVHASLSRPCLCLYRITNRWHLHCAKIRWHFEQMSKKNIWWHSNRWAGPCCAILACLPQ